MFSIHMLVNNNNYYLFIVYNKPACFDTLRLPYFSMQVYFFYLSFVHLSSITNNFRGFQYLSLHLAFFQ